MGLCKRLFENALKYLFTKNKNIMISQVLSAVITKLLSPGLLRRVVQYEFRDVSEISAVSINSAVSWLRWVRLG
jgi:hypothetical protein